MCVFFVCFFGCLRICLSPQSQEEERIKRDYEINKTKNEYEKQIKNYEETLTIRHQQFLAEKEKVSSDSQAIYETTTQNMSYTCVCGMNVRVDESMDGPAGPHGNRSALFLLASYSFWL